MILFKWVERGLGLISTLILVRLLSPADFGVVAMGLSFIFMGELLAAFSFDVALIQNQRATPDHYHSAWTLNVALGAGIAAFMLLLASPIAGFYGRPEVFPVVCVLALGPLLASLENIGVVAFRKDLEFRKEFLLQVSRKVIGFVVTVPLAFWLRSYWALVAGILAAKLGGTLVSYWAHPFRPRVSFSEVRSLMNFSRWLLLNNVVGFLKERSSDFVIGRLNGPAALGLYNVSYEFSNLPTNEIGAPINRALLPGYAKLKDDPGQVRITFANVAGVLAVIAIP
ncbi:MAG: oligosaccharide flippase family protein, partial [Gammaproteobacteria bacterium]|nr:oligosaccharide flippase family protein [Gammaproteobacteria bacterium]